MGNGLARCQNPDGTLCSLSFTYPLEFKAKSDAPYIYSAVAEAQWACEYEINNTNNAGT